MKNQLINVAKLASLHNNRKGEKVISIHPAEELLRNAHLSTRAIAFTFRSSQWRTSQRAR